MDRKSEALLAVGQRNLGHADDLPAGLEPRPDDAGSPIPRQELGVLCGALSALARVAWAVLLRPPSGFVCYWQVQPESTPLADSATRAKGATHGLGQLFTQCQAQP